MMKSGKWKVPVIAALVLFSLTACGESNDASKQLSSGAPVSKYPEKPITFVAPNGAGGGLDKMARLITKGLTDNKLVEQSLLVENKPGGGGTVYMAEFATKEKNNPYKLLVNSPPVLINNHKKEGNSPYGYKDTTPLAQLTRDYGAIVVAADSKYEDLLSLLKDIKEDPKSVNLGGGSSPGGMDHVLAMLPVFKFGLDPKTVKYVSYDGGGEAVTALMGGHLDVVAEPVSLALPYAAAGKVRILAVTSKERLGGALKDVPTMKELGVDAEFTIWRGVLGPKDMSEAEIAYWEKTFKALSEKEEWQQLLKSQGLESDYKNSKDFKIFLDEQDKQIKELLIKIGVAK